MATVTDDVTRADLVEALAYLNATAKEMRRKGCIGWASAEYARQHGRIDNLLDTLEKTP